MQATSCPQAEALWALDENSIFASTKPPYALLNHPESRFPNRRGKWSRLRKHRIGGQIAESPYTKAVPMTVQKRAEIAKAGHHNIVRLVHAAIHQLEIVGKNNKGFTPEFQRLLEQSFHLTVRTCGHLCMSQLVGAIMENRHGILVHTFALNWLDK